MRLATLMVASVLAIGVLWLAGEQHRKNCLSTGKTGCSVLPWDNGHAKDQGASKGGRLTARGCEIQQLINEQATREDQVKPLPPECR